MPQNPDQVINPIEEEILQFIKDNPGKSKSDVVRYLKDRHIAARIATLAHIDRLEGKEMIICQLENPNSQIYKIFINENNKLATILVELEEFKAVYSNLLEKAKERLDNKDYTVDAKALGIKGRDPARWSYEEKKRYNTFWFRKHYEISDRVKKLNVKERKQISRERGSLTEEEQEIKRAIRGNPYYLILNPIILFYIIVDVMFFRSIIKWPNEISDEEILSQMYSITYKKVAEIQFELSKFLQSVKLGPADPVTTLIDYRYTGSKPDFWSCVYFYREINMDSEIRQIIKLIIKLNEDIKDLKLFKSDDPDITYGLVEDIAEFTNELNERKSLQEMLIGHEYKYPTITKKDSNTHTQGQVTREIVERIPDTYGNEINGEELELEEKKTKKD